MMEHWWGGWLGIVAAVTFLAGGLAFAPARTGARSLVVERLAPSRRWRRFAFGLVVQLAAIGMLAGAVFELARTLVGDQRL